MSWLMRPKAAMPTSAAPTPMNAVAPTNASRGGWGKYVTAALPPLPTPVKPAVPKLTAVPVKPAVLQPVTLPKPTTPVAPVKPTPVAATATAAAAPPSRQVIVSNKTVATPSFPVKTVIVGGVVATALGLGVLYLLRRNRR